MPRPLPELADEFAAEIRKAEQLTCGLEAARIVLNSRSRSQSHIALASLELTYELAFLRVFLAWEVFLEQTFVRLLCGYVTPSGNQEPLLPGISYYRTMAAAEVALLRGQQFKAWYNPNHVISRASSFFARGNFELVIASKQSDLENFAAIRHRIAHAQEHARRNFDAATMSLAARRYRASRPGRFLRDFRSRSVPPTRWLFSISSDLLGLARQICP